MMRLMVGAALLFLTGCVTNIDESVHDDIELLLPPAEWLTIPAELPANYRTIGELWLYSKQLEYNYGIVINNIRSLAEWRALVEGQGSGGSEESEYD